MNEFVDKLKSLLPENLIKVRKVCVILIFLSKVYIFYVMNKLWFLNCGNCLNSKRNTL